MLGLLAIQAVVLETQNDYIHRKGRMIIYTEERQNDYIHTGKAE
jgi:hypothetical protein